MHDHLSHSHHHHHPLDLSTRAGHRRRLMFVLIFSVVFMIVEVLGGFFSGSLALFADAGHMFSDSVALALSMGALWIAERKPTPERSYGYHRIEILAALLNGVLLIAMAISICIEAGERFFHPEPVQGPMMTGIALMGLFVNLGGLWMLRRARDESLNMRGAWLHLLTDALGSVGALGAGFLVWQFNWVFADALISVVIALLVIYSAWALIKDAVDILMEGTPKGMSLEAVRNAMSAVSHVDAVHDLHIWSLASGRHALSAHVLSRVRDEALLRNLQTVLLERFGISHVTIQVEYADVSCVHC